MDDLEKLYYFWAGEYVSRNEKYINDCAKVTADVNSLFLSSQGLLCKYSGKGLYKNNLDMKYEEVVYSKRFRELKTIHEIIKNKIETKHEICGDFEDIETFRKHTEDDAREFDFYNKFEDLELFYDDARYRWGYPPRKALLGKSSEVIMNQVIKGITKSDVIFRINYHSQMARPIRYSHGELRVALDYPIEYLKKILIKAKKRYTDEIQGNFRFIDSFLASPVHRPRVGIEQTGNYSRAIGIWLYDYINSNSCTKKDAMRQLRNSKSFEKMNIYPDDGDLRFYIRRTSECIKAAEVLPFTKRKKGTKDAK